MIENGAGFQQKNGAFNEGAVSQLAWDTAPVGQVSQIEARFSRDTLDAEGDNVLSSTDILLSFVARNLDWQIVDTLEGIPYELADTPDPFEGTAAVIDLQDGAWDFQESGDPGVEWVMPEFVPDDSWGHGVGFLGYGLADGLYPPVTVPLTAGQTTYYFRTSFEWDFDTLGAAFLADVYLSDGAVIYLNGKEVRRVRMPEGAIDSATLATGVAATPGVVETFSLPSSAVTVGMNHIAVEVHQAAESAGELAFGWALRASDNDPPSQLDPTQPEDRDVIEGQQTVFAPGTIAGAEPFTFQWYKEDQPLEGATGAVLEIAAVLEEDAGTYAVEISTPFGSVRSRAAKLTTTAVPVALVNESEPMDREVVEGESTTFTVEATGSALLSFQWHKNGEPLDGETGASYTIEAVGTEHAGAYHVTVANRVNTVSSRMAQLTVVTDRVPPAIQSLTAGSGKISVQFTEALDETSALLPTNYALPGIELIGVELSDDGRTVTLTTGNFPFGEAVPFRVDGVKDLFGNMLNVSAPFRATILIDGEFDDWEGITPTVSDPEEIGENGEFKDFWIVNDGEFLYLRFSFHGEIGPLPTSHFYQLYFDADNDPGTGFQVSGIGSSMMIENGLGWLQREGGFNEGSVGNTGFQIAPSFPSTQFECRISLQSSVNADQSRVFTSDSVAVAFNLMNTSWESIDTGPVEDSIIHSLMEWLPPNLQTEVFQLSHLEVGLDATAVTIVWPSTEGSTYTVERSPDLQNWTELADGLPATDVETTYTDETVSKENAHLYYRVNIE